MKKKEVVLPKQWKKKEREKAENELLKHHRRLTLSYEKMVRPCFVKAKWCLKLLKQ
ncbi:hypothetical protein SESBI_39576 [Sesbania bispinosa]|nr:hypothetical protein SESBI_39576 [Sesbania bispinosa]